MANDVQEIVLSGNKDYITINYKKPLEQQISLAYSKDCPLKITLI